MAKKTKAADLSIEEKLEQALVVPGYEPYKIPDNWCWVRFRYLSKIQTGKKDANYGAENGIYPFFTCASLPIRCNGYSFDCNAILLAGNGDISNISVFNGKFEAYQRTYVVECHTSLNLKCIYYYFKYRWVDYNKDKMFGTAIPYIRLGNIQDFCVPVPPFPEQHRIVERIESLFSKLDEAKEKAQGVIDSFETRKAAILHKAFSGELTAKWREENGVGIESWKNCSLVDVLIEKPRNGYSPKPVDYPTSVKSMTLSATTSGIFMPEHFKYIDESISNDSYLWLKNGDILIQRANSIDKVGTSAIYTGGNREFIYPDLMMKLQVISDVSNYFIAYQLKTQRIIQYFRSNATGTTGNMPKINQKVVSMTPIVRPSFDEQNEIVHILDNLFEKEIKEKDAAESVIDQIDTMKKAILARAFRGELGTNDPEEESAVELLKEILSGNNNEEEAQKPKRTRIVIPKEIDSLLKTELERKIIKLFLKSSTGELTAEEIMAVSSKKFDILNTIRILQKQHLIIKSGNKNYTKYTLVR